MTRLKVALLWHQHQPLYRSPRTGKYSLPWVRLHGLKDYYDMAALAGEHPRLHLTFNLVPSLLDQLDDYVSGRAVDPALELARRPASDLNEPERLALLDLFFSVPYRTLIAPYPRYAALFHKRQTGTQGDGESREAVARFKPEELRDLQVWFHLAWSGPELRRRTVVKELIRKGESFSEQDKLALLDLQGEFLKEIVPIHRKLQDEGIAEISTSPYYHPILPLLCDLSSAREAIPDLPLPDIPFRYPQDAAFQVREGMDFTQRRFGRRPAGVWPSEGSLSDQTLGVLGGCGVRWTASDEGVLKASLGHSGSPEMLHRPYRVDAAGESCPAIFFRDTALSDLIGFTYSTWPAAAAAADFLARLRALAEIRPGGVVSVILDGENAWEHFPDNGVEFLRALYEGLTRSEWIETVTFSQALDAEDAASSPGKLGRLRAGSWIGSSLTTWIGHPEKNKAWRLLAAARQMAEAALGDDAQRAPAFKALAAAEGSDWFWWFGDDHASEQDAIFDASFRDLLRSVYLMLERPAPAELDQPIKKLRAQGWSQPTGLLKPTLDGEVTDYFEWLPAGRCEAAAGQGAMHQSAGLVRAALFGTDGRSLFIRVDPHGGDIQSLLHGLSGGALAIEVVSPQPMSLRFRMEEDVVAQSEGAARLLYAAGSVLEVAVPLATTQPVEFFIALASQEGTLQRLPREGVICVSPEPTTDWSV